MISYQGFNKALFAGIEGVPSNSHDTVDGRYPAPVKVGSLCHYFTRFYTFQVVQDFCSINSISCKIMAANDSPVTSRPVTAKCRDAPIDSYQSEHLR